MRTPTFRARTAAVCALAAAVGLQAADANNECPQAQTLPPNGGPFNNAGATQSPDNQLFITCAAGPMTFMWDDVWFRWTSPFTGEATLDTFGTPFDTKLAVYSGGACPATTARLIACNDDTGSNPPGNSLVRFQASAGEQFLIQVGAFAPASGGPGVLNVTPPCRADFDRSGRVDVADIFTFLSAWFAQGAGSDFNSSGTTDVADIFAFLSAWFAGC